MIAKGWACAVGVASVALLIAGCSRGGDSAPTVLATTTTVARRATTTVGRATGVRGGGAGPLNVAASLGPCPSSPPIDSQTLRNLNERAHVGRAKLVPITAQTMRVCTYPSGPGSVAIRNMFGLDTAARFEGQTNQLPLLGGRRSSVPCAAGTPETLLTFANDSQQVDVLSRCDDVSNGRAAGLSTTTWRNELERGLLQLYFSGSPPIHAVPDRTSGPTG